MRNPWILAILIFASSSAQARFGNEAMFGFKWGMTSGEAKKLAPTLTAVQDEGGIAFYETKLAPKPISSFNHYILIFAHNRLVKVIASGKPVTRNPSGSEAKEKYDALKILLRDKYRTPGKSDEHIDSTPYNEIDNFYDCISDAGCGRWITVFETKDKLITLSINGATHGIGYVAISAESVPEFSSSTTTKDRETNSTDRDAL